MRPSTMTGYGSLSNCRNGAAASTRSITLRWRSSFELLFTFDEMSGLMSPKRRAKAARRTNESSFTPSWPV